MLFTVLGITQFRAIAWFNVALGMTCIVLQLLMLRGESDCKKCDTRCANCRCGKEEKFKIKWMAVSVSFIQHGIL